MPAKLYAFMLRGLVLDWYLNYKFSLALAASNLINAYYLLSSILFGMELPFHNTSVPAIFISLQIPHITY